MQITTSDNTENSGDNNSGQSGDETSGQSGDYSLKYLTIGDPLTLYCTVTAVRGISSSVDIIWTTGGRELRRVSNLMADIEYDSAIYTDSFEISSLSAIDNGRVYECAVVINATQPVYNSDEFTLTFSGEYMHNVICEHEVEFLIFCYCYKCFKYCILELCSLLISICSYICT